jgi:hypothetical protein
LLLYILSGRAVLLTDPALLKAVTPASIPDLLSKHIQLSSRHALVRPALHHLVPLPVDGLACEQDRCSFITINVDTLPIHTKKHHNIAWKGDTSTLYKRVKVQTFFRTGGLQRYFVVRAADSSNALAVSREVADVVEERLAEWQLTQRAHEERAQVIDAHVAKTDKTGWFERTGWLEHFANRNLMHLAHQTRLPDRGEVKLRQAAKLTEMLVERSFKGLSTLARETRRWLKSAKR